jgi:hypothetical protein
LQLWYQPDQVQTHQKMRRSTHPQPVEKDAMDASQPGPSSKESLMRWASCSGPRSGYTLGSFLQKYRNVLEWGFGYRIYSSESPFLCSC